MTVLIARSIPWLALAACVIGRLVLPRWCVRVCCYKTRYGRY